MKSNRRTMLGITVVVLILMAVLLGRSRVLSNQLKAGETQISELKEQTDEENERTKDISDLQDYMNSDEYKEKVAKEKLGMIRDGEILFKEAE